MICFQISIFEPLNTANSQGITLITELWFAFKLVSLSHWIQPPKKEERKDGVVICFQISIFEPLNTAHRLHSSSHPSLWFAFKLVSLSHWIQHPKRDREFSIVVICFQISIFEPLNTAVTRRGNYSAKLWFAFKLVSLSHWIQQRKNKQRLWWSCDLLSN